MKVYSIFKTEIWDSFFLAKKEEKNDIFDVLNIPLLSREDDVDYNYCYCTYLYYIMGFKVVSDFQKVFCVKVYLCIIWISLSKSNILILFTQPLRSGRIWHKVIF